MRCFTNPHQAYSSIRVPVGEVSDGKVSVGADSGDLVEHRHRRRASAVVARCGEANFLRGVAGRDGRHQPRNGDTAHDQSHEPFRSSHHVRPLLLGQVWASRPIAHNRFSAPSRTTLP